jgi:uroporphyrinogen-III synthase
MLQRAPLCIAVGRATEAALRSLGMDCATAPPGAEDSEGTLGLSALQSVHGQRIALWVAPGGRDKLAQTLRQRGAEVRNIMIYRRLPKRAPARVIHQLRGAADRLVLTATSGGLLEQLDTQLARAKLSGLRARPLIVASERIAQIARAKGYRCVHISRGAGAEALIEALKSLNP